MQPNEAEQEESHPFNQYVSDFLIFFFISFILFISAVCQIEFEYEKQDSDCVRASMVVRYVYVEICVDGVSILGLWISFFSSFVNNNVFFYLFHVNFFVGLVYR